MRIAYVTPYQGPTLVERRPVVGNRSMSNRVKIELIGKLLSDIGHDVEVFSHGEVDAPRLHYYPAFEEPERFHSAIPVHYISALPIRRVYGLWAKHRLRALLERRHRANAFDAVIIFNLKPPQLAAASYALGHGIPLILEYEDDAFKTTAGAPETGLRAHYHQRAYRRVLTSVSGCMAVSPHLLSQVPSGVPTLLLRGVVGDDVVTASERAQSGKKDIVLYSGTHTKWNGVEELIMAWRAMALRDWELHITGYGDMTDSLRRLADESPGIAFHGLVSRAELIDLMASAKICVSPQLVSRTQGNQFAFKVIEYLAAGAHVVMTPMGDLEPEIEAAITYMPDNRPETIASTLRRVIKERTFTKTASHAVHRQYGTQAVRNSLGSLLMQVAGRSLKTAGVTAGMRDETNG